MVGRVSKEETAQLRRRIAELETRVFELEAKENKYKRAERLMAAECAVTRVLAECTSPSQAISRILQTICESLGWKLGEFWSIDLKANLLFCKESWNIP